MYSSSLRREILARVCAITGVFSAVSYVIIERKAQDVAQVGVAVPLLFVLCGAVLVVNLIYALRRHSVPDAK
ncbi:MAG TPA: hypothetical protein VJ792_05930 [Candidatus Nitrosotalea sp.]|nr:hypothetical protein [Candidatus Nitrosotalea sp.]